MVSGENDASSEVDDEKQRKGKSKKHHTPASELLANNPNRFTYHQFLGMILVVGFIIIGTAAGTFFALEKLMMTPCLGCLGLFPDVELEFVFETVDNRPHPDFVLDSLEEAPVFIEFTQNDENCPPCKRMRPKVHELIKEYSDNVVFYIINVNENEVHKEFQNNVQTYSILDSEEEEIYQIYDLKNIVGGGVAAPTYVIITINEDTDGNVKPNFAVGYGIFIEEDESKTKDSLAEALDYATTMYYHYREMYISK